MSRRPLAGKESPPPLYPDEGRLPTAIPRRPPRRGTACNSFSRLVNSAQDRSCELALHIGGEIGYSCHHSLSRASLHPARARDFTCQGRRGRLLASALEGNETCERMRGGCVVASLSCPGSSFRRA